MQNIDIRLKPSWIFIALILCIFFTSIGLVVSLSISSKIKLLLLILIVVYLLWVIKSARTVQKLRYLQTGDWLIITKKDQFIGRIASDSTVTRWVVILRFEVPNRWFKYSVVVFHDALDDVLYRQLVLQLRCHTS